MGTELILDLSHLAPGARVSQLQPAPCMLLLASWPQAGDMRVLARTINILLASLSKASGRRYLDAFVRCCCLDRLDTILKNGVDVEPPDSVIWVDQSISKPLEYGGDEKVMMMFDPGKLEQTWCEVPCDAPETQLNTLRATYPTMFPSQGGTHLWFSRLPENDRRVMSGYEAEHGKWIPGDPWEALLGLIPIGPDHDALATRAEAALAKVASAASG